MTSTPSARADRAELIRALAVLCEMPSPATASVAAALDLESPDPVEHTELFVNQLPPYASIYLDTEGKIGGEARERIAGFWLALGATPPTEPDHLAALLGLWSTLIEASPGPIDGPRQLLAEHAQKALVSEHLAVWLTPYLARVAEIAPQPYRRWSLLLQATVDMAMETHDEEPALPRHLAFMAAIPERPDDLIPYLLAPVRSGIILTRADLNRAATELRLGIRIGERAYAMKALLDQAQAQVVRWISTEALRQADQLERRPGSHALRRHWATRARGTASILEQLLTGVPSGEPGWTAHQD